MFRAPGESEFSFSRGSLERSIINSIITTVAEPVSELV